MANNVTLPGSGSVVESIDVGGGVERQVVAIGSAGFVSKVALTRSTSTSSYSDGDVVGSSTSATAALTFASLGSSAGGEYQITSAALMVEDSSIISNETSYTLHLYSATPPSSSVDNAAWDIPSGDRSTYLGYIYLGAPVDIGSSLYVQTDSIIKQVTLSSSSLFGYLVSNTGYVPTSSRVYDVTLHSVAV